MKSRQAILLLMTVIAISISAPAQAPTPAASPTEPAVTELRGVSIGMELDAVKEKLGEPKVEDKTGMVYNFGKGESLQIGLDAEKKVRTIANIFSGSGANPPAFEDIFGTGIEATVRKDGSVYKLVRYHAAGFWIAYNKTAGKNAMTIITMRKIRKRAN